ncbi:MAG: MgtC/SapB family protein [Bacteroidetes bacterium]|nr:MgtC/SapB family protein [Bacteroidota bacterium]
MLSWSEIILRLLLASLFGAFVGLERERKSETAGMRTHMMVCVGSCLIMMVSAFGFADILGTPNVTLDPSRIAAQVVSGIGFIGAGTILLLKQGTIRGLTTASGLWTVAAVGLATGSGMYFAAAATTFIALAILWALKPLERMYAAKYKQRTLRIVTGSEDDSKSLLETFAQEPYSKMQTFTMERVEADFVFEVRFVNPDFAKAEVLLELLKGKIFIKEISWND